MIVCFYRVLVGWCIFTLCLLSDTDLWAQNSSTQLWKGLEAEFNLSEVFKLDVQQQFRFNTSTNIYDQIFTNVGLYFQLNKNLAVKSHYRHFFENNPNDRARISLDGYYLLNFNEKPFSMNYRVRFDYEKAFHSPQNTSFMRSKIALGYDLTGVLTLFLSQELFLRLNGYNQLKRWRLTTGVSWEISGKVILGAFYRYQQAVNVDLNESTHIIGINITYRALAGLFE